MKLLGIKKKRDLGRVEYKYIEERPRKQARKRERAMAKKEIERDYPPLDPLPEWPF